ncbi:hypothetical protein WJX75_002891 [Coccomyxa subellipsoidea]|uniref:Uncharacterized protein n=1 Tax=Coccomyxa subellipsoidea TaxID=248742 RepID=A0ABR2YMC5_9CHLO
MEDVDQRNSETRLNRRSRHRNVRIDILRLWAIGAIDLANFPAATASGDTRIHVQYRQVDCTPVQAWYNGNVAIRVDRRTAHKILQQAVQMLQEKLS